MVPWRRTILALALLLASACAAPPVPGPTAPGGTPTYAEPYRPQFHFSPPSMWMNDPNGMVHFQGEYHLFYQYYPGDKVWGPMHWGHAVSTDLVHWAHLPVALYPDEHGYIFSGSAVVDWHNSSGFGAGGEPPLIALFTYHDAERGEAGATDHEAQGIAYSNDRGRSWTKYADNPVLPNPGDFKDFRDPKVFWHQPSATWVMALSATDHVQFWSSDDLKAWRHLSDFGRGLGAHGGVWECPDLLEMPVQGTDHTRWVLIQNLNPGGPQGGSGTQYFVGDFDGERFELDALFEASLGTSGAAWLDTGRDNYAGVTWSDVPEADGRTLFIGWMGNWDYAQQVPTHPWRSAMTLPRELTLHDTPSGYRVHSNPVAELESLRRADRDIAPRQIGAGEQIELDTGIDLGSSEWHLEFELPQSGPIDFGIELGNARGEYYRLGYEGTHNQLYSDRTAAGDHSFSETFAGIHFTQRHSNARTLELELFLDAASIEVFVDGGANVITETWFPSTPFTAITVYSNGAPLELSGGKAWELASIWPSSPPDINGE